MTGLQQLTQLDLAYTNITDSGVHSLQHLTNLLDLNLDSCNITDRCASCIVMLMLEFSFWAAWYTTRLLVKITERCSLFFSFSI